MEWVAISFSNAWKWKVKVKSLSHVWLFATPWTTAYQAPLSFTVSWSLLKFMAIESVMIPKDLILCRSLLSPAIFPSVRAFFSEPSLCIRWPKYWSFSFSIGPFNEYSGLISFRIDWFDLLVQGILKSLPQHHNLRMSVLQCSAFSVVQLSHLCVYSLSHFWLFETLLGCSPPGSSVYGILQARILEWVSFSTHIPMWL